MKLIKFIIISYLYAGANAGWPADNCNEILSIGPEWGKIHTAVIGNPRGARFPQELPQMLRATLPSGETLHEILQNPGSPFDPTLVTRATHEIDGLIKRLQSLGVNVLQPVVSDDFFASPIKRKKFTTNAGLYAAMPRDGLLLLPPNIVVLAPMAWRSRQREHEAYANVIEGLRSMGLQVVSAPRPQLGTESYDQGWKDYEQGPLRPVITEHEPLFDAADFIRFGNHIVGQLSHVTNKKGIAWIRSILPPEFRLHIIEFNDPHAMHVDATLMPLMQGKVLIHPERVPSELRHFLRAILFRGWKMVEVPYPDQGAREAPLYFTSRWINMNILVGDGWALVEKKDQGMQDLLKKEGLDPIPCPLQHFQALGGSFHCASLDIRETENSDSHYDAETLSQDSDVHIYRDAATGRYDTEPLMDFLMR